MTTSNIAFYIYTTGKNHNRCKNIENTWGKNQNLYFFTDTLVEEDNYIVCTPDDTYISHMYKNFHAIEYAHIKHINLYDWFIFIGDDTFFYIESLKNTLNNLDINDNSAYGEVSNTWIDKSLYYILGGGGVIFNKTSLINFNSKKFPLNQLNPIGYSDVAIGIICNHLNIKMVNIDTIHSQPPEFYHIDKPNTHCSFHYIKTTEDFNRLNNLI
jgi:hypothetical protein